MNKLNDLSILILLFLTFILIFIAGICIGYKASQNNIIELQKTPILEQAEKCRAVNGTYIFEWRISEGCMRSECYVDDTEFEMDISDFFEFDYPEYEELYK